MNRQEKLRLAHQLDRLGVDVIEAGFPIASDGDFESVKAIASVVRRPIIAGLARACRPDIERAWEALKDAARPRIHVFLATSDIHLQYKLRITRDNAWSRRGKRFGSRSLFARMLNFLRKMRRGRTQFSLSRIEGGSRSGRDHTEYS